MQQDKILEATILVFALIGVFATVRWLRGSVRRLVGVGRPVREFGSTHAPESSDRKPGYVVDGSNVLYWAGDGPDLGSVRAVVRKLTEKGKDLHVFFDATVGYKVFGRHVSSAQLAGAIDLSASQVTIVPGGTDADVFILRYAGQHRDTIVTNDQFKDNAKLAKGLQRMPGVVSGGKVVFES